MKTTIDMAREAGFKEHNGMVFVTTINNNCAEELKRFAELVRADEREACAKVCMKQQSDLQTRQRYAAAIRNRGSK